LLFSYRMNPIRLSQRQHYVRSVREENGHQSLWTHLPVVSQTLHQSEHLHRTFVYIQPPVGRRLAVAEPVVATVVQRRHWTEVRIGYRTLPAVRNSMPRHERAKNTAQTPTHIDTQFTDAIKWILIITARTVM